MRKRAGVDANTIGSARVIVVAKVSKTKGAMTVRDFRSLNFFYMSGLPPALLPGFLRLVGRSKGGVGGITLIVSLHNHRFFSRLFGTLSRLSRAS